MRARLARPRLLRAVHEGEQSMPFETIAVLSAVIAAFALFGVTLAWADFYTRGLRR